MEKAKVDIDIKKEWEGMIGGNEQAFSEIFTLFYSDLYQYGIKIFNLPDLVKDTIQDVFIRIWERRDTIGDVQSPKAYLISSVRRKLFHNRGARKNEIIEGVIKRENHENFSFITSEFIEIKEFSAQLKNLLATTINGLPERQRELILLRFYYNFKYKEIAGIMEINEQTVRNLMQRALAKLRQKIDRTLWEDIDNIDQLLLTFFFLIKKYSNSA